MSTRVPRPIHRSIVEYPVLWIAVTAFAAVATFLVSGVTGALGILLVGTFVRGWFFKRLASPNPNLPRFAILRPFGSDKRDFILANWVGSALFQFGEPVLVVDAMSHVARQHRAPDKSAISRVSKFCYFRVLGEERWDLEILPVLRDSAIIVVDTSVLRVNLFVEFAALEAQGRMGRVISIHQRPPSAELADARTRYSGASPLVGVVVAASIAYDPMEPESMRRLWVAVVERAAALLDVRAADVPSPTPPDTFLFRPEMLALGLARIIDGPRAWESDANVRLPDGIPDSATKPAVPQGLERLR